MHRTMILFTSANRVLACAGEWYDDDEQVCCRGRLLTLIQGWQCCGPLYIDPMVNYCCRWKLWNMRVVPREKGKSKEESCRDLIEKLQEEGEAEKNKKKPWWSF